MNTNVLADKKIDEAYDTLLKVADGEKISDEQAKNISELLEENISEDDKLLRAIQSGEVNVEVGGENSVTANVTIDPMTGKAMKIDIPDEDKKVTDLDDLLSDDMSDVDEKYLKYSEKNISEGLKRAYGMEIPDSEIAILTNCLNRYKDGESIGYKDLPTSIKSKIANIIMKENNSIYTGNLELKNQMAKIFIDALAQETLQAEMGNIFVDLQDSITKLANTELNSAYNSAFESQRKVLEVEILNIADKIETEKPDKAAMLRNMNHAYRQSYLLTEMLDTYMNTGRCRIKKIDIEKVERIYDGFNRKYEDSKWIVRDISMLEPVLMRKLSDDIEFNQIRAFLIVFCKYCMNMNPENIDQHTFMYYFIMNILNLDIFDPDNEEDGKFYLALIETIEKFIHKIKEKSGI